MMRRWVALIVAFTRVTSSLDGDVSQLCSLGIKNDIGIVCCPRSCGACGGKECLKRPGGVSCCGLGKKRLNLAVCATPEETNCKLPRGSIAGRRPPVDVCGVSGGLCTGRTELAQLPTANVSSGKPNVTKARCCADWTGVNAESYESPSTLTGCVRHSQLSRLTTNASRIEFGKACLSWGCQLRDERPFFENASSGCVHTEDWLDHKIIAVGMTQPAVMVLRRVFESLHLMPISSCEKSTSKFGCLSPQVKVGYGLTDYWTTDLLVSAMMRPNTRVVLAEQYPLLRPVNGPAMKSRRLAESLAAQFGRERVFLLDTGARDATALPLCQFLIGHAPASQRRACRKHLTWPPYLHQLTKEANAAVRRKTELGIEMSQLDSMLMTRQISLEPSSSTDEAVQYACEETKGKRWSSAMLQRLHFFAFVAPSNLQLLERFFDFYAAVGVSFEFPNRARVILHSLPGGLMDPNDARARDLIRRHLGTAYQQNMWLAADWSSTIKTAFVNDYIAELKPSALLIYPDLDEFFDAPPRLIEEEVLKNHGFVRGYMMDRVARDWTLKELDETTSISQLYPLRCTITRYFHVSNAKWIIVPARDARNETVTFQSAHSVFNELNFTEAERMKIAPLAFSHYRFDSAAYKSTLAKLKAYADKPVRVQSYKGVLAHFDTSGVAQGEPIKLLMGDLPESKSNKTQLCARACPPL